MHELRKRDIRKTAENFRLRCNISRYGIIDLFDECSRSGYKLLRYPLGETGCLGFAVKRDHDVIIFSNTSSRLSRELFTVAHEIGHALLHFRESSIFMDDNNTISEKSTDEKEQEANYFAACLLMPEVEVQKFVKNSVEFSNEGNLTAYDIARMMSEFHVSFDMALNRLETLGVITKGFRLLLDCEKNEKRVSNLLRSVGGSLKLNEASEIVDIPHEYLEYAIYNYNNRVIPENTLKKVLEYYSLSMEDISEKLVTFEDETEDDLEKLIGGLEN